RNWSKNIGNYTGLEISPEICEALEALSHLLPPIFGNLPPRLSTPLLRDLAATLDAHILTRVVLRGSFSEEGARQFAVDVRDGIWRGVFGRWGRKPEGLFRRLKDAMTLLTLPAADAPNTVGSLLEQLSVDDADTAVVALAEVGVHRLSPKEAVEVLQRRL
ncbi:RINT-1/TIP-20, partial [Blyttiomyces helicus]